MDAVAGRGNPARGKSGARLAVGDTEYGQIPDPTVSMPGVERMRYCVERGTYSGCADRAEAHILATGARA